MSLEDFDWRQVIGSVAPGLAAALGGPLAGAAVKVIADKVLGRPEASQEEVAEALSSGSITGDQLVALKVAEQSFKLELERIDQQRETAGVEDTKSARQQTVDLAKEGSTIAWGAPVVSTLIVVGFFSCVLMLYFRGNDLLPNVTNLLNTLLGALILGFGQVCNYWLGSSAGSKRSGDAVRKIAEQAGKG